MEEDPDGLDFDEDFLSDLTVGELKGLTQHFSFESPGTSDSDAETGRSRIDFSQAGDGEEKLSNETASDSRVNNTQSDSILQVIDEDSLLGDSCGLKASSPSVIDLTPEIVQDREKQAPSNKRQKRLKEYYDPGVGEIHSKEVKLDDVPGNKFFFGDRIFKVEESYRLKSVGAYKSYPVEAIFTIKKLFYTGSKNQKWAACEVFVPLGATFLGETEAARVTSARDACNEGNVEYIRFRYSRDIQLWYFQDQCDRPQRISSFMYEPEPTAAKGHKWRLAYKSRDADIDTLPLFCAWPPNVLDLFAGAGGMSLGFEKAGFNVPWLVDKDHSAAATLKINHGKERAVVFNEDVLLFMENVKNEEPGYPHSGCKSKVHHLHASPPCQGFSPANRNGGKNDEANNRLSLSFPTAVELLQPYTASFENVPGLLRDKHIGVVKTMLANLLILGYQVSLNVVDSSQYGDPQLRQRVILLASKNCPLPEMPKATHGQGLEPPVTCKDALGVIQNSEPMLGSGLVVVQESGRSIRVFDHAQNDTPYTEFEKIEADKQAPTVRASSGVLKHYNFDRSLTIREYALLQSFPLDYAFAGLQTAQRKQIGNAVPVKLATAIAESIKKVYCPENALEQASEITSSARAGNAIATNISQPQSKDETTRQSSTNITEGGLARPSPLPTRLDATLGFGAEPGSPPSTRSVRKPVHRVSEGPRELAHTNDGTLDRANSLPSQSNRNASRSPFDVSHTLGLNVGDRAYPAPTGPGDRPSATASGGDLERASSCPNQLDRCAVPRSDHSVPALRNSAKNPRKNPYAK